MAVFFDSFTGKWRSSLVSPTSILNRGFSSKRSALSADSQAESRRKDELSRQERTAREKRSRSQTIKAQGASRKQSERQRIQDIIRRRGEQKRRAQAIEEARKQQQQAQDSLNQQLSFQREQATAQQQSLQDFRQQQQQFFQPQAPSGAQQSQESAQSKILEALLARQTQDDTASQQAFIESALPEAERQLTQLLVGRGLGGRSQALAVGRAAGEIGTQAKLRAGGEKRADIASLLAQFGGIGQELGGRRQSGFQQQQLGQQSSQFGQSQAQQESQFSRNITNRNIQSQQERLARAQQPLISLFGGKSLF